MNSPIDGNYEFSFTDLKERLEIAKKNHVTKILELSEKGEMLTDNQFAIVVNELERIYTKEKHDFEENNSTNRKQEMFDFMQKTMAFNNSSR